ncbi:hypothetical protein [Microcoleus sp. Z1_B2]
MSQGFKPLAVFGARSILRLKLVPMGNAVSDIAESQLSTIG